MNKALLVIVFILAAAVVLLSGALFYTSQAAFRKPGGPIFQPDSRMSGHPPFPAEQRAAPVNLPPPPFFGERSGMAPGEAQPGRLAGDQQGRRPPGGPNPAGGSQDRRAGQPDAPGMSQPQGPDQPGRQPPGFASSQAGARDQTQAAPPQPAQQRR